MSAGELTQEDLEALLGTVQVMSSALSGMTGTYFTPGPRWRAFPESGEVNYDLGLTAMLDDQQRVAVAAHEIAHLRYTRRYRWKRPVADLDARIAHLLMNTIEDRRIELLLCEEYPGFEGPLRTLRAALSNPHVVRAAQNAAPHLQLLVGAQARAYSEAFTAADSHAAAALARLEDDILAGTVARTTQKLADILGREDGLLDVLLDLRGAPALPPLPRPAAALELPPASSEGGEVGPGVGEVDEDEDELAEAVTEATPSEDEPEPFTSFPSDSSLALLSEEQANLLEEITNSAAAQRSDEQLEPVRCDAAQIIRSLHGSRKALRAVQQRVRALQASSGGVDDSQIGETNDGDYDQFCRLLDSTRQSASVLARGLMVVLQENRTDRFSAIGYRTGARIHTRALARAATGSEERIWRRRTRNRNRNYAVAILCDASGSMRKAARSQCAASAILASSALEQAGGCESAIYSFGSQVLQLKGFDQVLDERAHHVGALRRIDKGGTQMGEAIERAGGDMLGRYDDSWRRVILVITDGFPNGKDPEPIVRSLIRAHEFDCFGIGIRTAGFLARIFPHWIAISDAWELPPALMRMLSKAVVRG